MLCTFLTEQAASLRPTSTSPAQPLGCGPIQVQCCITQTSKVNLLRPLTKAGWLPFKLHLLRPLTDYGWLSTTSNLTMASSSSSSSAKENTCLHGPLPHTTTPPTVFTRAGRVSLDDSVEVLAQDEQNRHEIRDANKFLASFIFHHPGHGHIKLAGQISSFFSTMGAFCKQWNQCTAKFPSTA